MDEFMNEFMQEMSNVYPKLLIQFEVWNYSGPEFLTYLMTGLFN